MSFGKLRHVNFPQQAPLLPTLNLMNSIHTMAPTSLISTLILLSLPLTSFILLLLLLLLSSSYTIDLAH